MRFEPGQSGNPKGRPKGIVDKRSELSQLLRPHAKDLVSKAVELALAGDCQALKLCLERLIPRARDEVIGIDRASDDLTKTMDLMVVGAAILKAVMDGDITPEQGRTISNVIEAQRKTIETSELVARIHEIEVILKQRKTP